MVTATRRRTRCMRDPWWRRDRPRISPDVCTPPDSTPRRMLPRRRDSRSTHRRASLAAGTAVDAVSPGRTPSGALRRHREGRNVSSAAWEHAPNRHSMRRAAGDRTRARREARRERRRPRGRPRSVRSMRRAGGILRRRRSLLARRRNTGRGSALHKSVPRGTASSGTPSSGTPRRRTSRTVAVDRNSGLRRECPARVPRPSDHGRRITGTSIRGRGARPALVATRSRGAPGRRPHPITSTLSPRGPRSEDPAADGLPRTPSVRSKDGAASRRRPSALAAGEAQGSLQRMPRLKTLQSRTRPGSTRRLEPLAGL